jgi:hypothetical protein
MGVPTLEDLSNAIFDYGRMTGHPEGTELLLVCRPSDRNVLVANVATTGIDSMKL